jgi:hypothetical protein
MIPARRISVQSTNDTIFPMERKWVNGKPRQDDALRDDKITPLLNQFSWVGIDYLAQG